MMNSTERERERNFEERASHSAYKTNLAYLPNAGVFADAS